MKNSNHNIHFMMLLLLFSTWILVYGEDRNERLTIGISGSYKKHKYKNINSNLKKYHNNTDMPENRYYWGLESTYFYKKILIQGSFSRTSEIKKGVAAALSFSPYLKIGFTPWIKNSYILTGFGWEYLQIQMNSDYIYRCADCFFNGRWRYSINDQTILLGVAYIREVAQTSWRKNIMVGIEGGWVYPVTNHLWNRNGGDENSVRSVFLIPEFTAMNYYLKLNLGIDLINKK